MAMKLNAGEVTKTEVYLIDPKEIQVDESLNGRRYPHDDASVAALARSFADEGQLQPVQVRKIADHRVQLILGYRRWRACVLYNETHPDQPMKLKCTIVQVNEEEAFRKNITENRERAETTCVDDAFNQRRLRDQFGWNDKRIAEFYSMSAAYVGQLKKLLSLPTEIQEQVHRKELSFQAALALSDLPETEQKAIVQEVRAEQVAMDPVPVPAPTIPVSGVAPVQASAPRVKLPTSSILDRTRTAKQANGSATNTARTMKDVRAFLQAMTSSDRPERASMLAKAMLDYIGGKLKDSSMVNKWTELTK